MIAECGKARAGNLGNPFVAWIGNNLEQLRDSFASDWSDNAEFGKVSPDRINHRRLLANEQMPCAVKHQATLLLRRLGWYEAHIDSSDGFADCLSVSHVVLLPFDERLHVSRRHQPHRMSKGLQLARPMVRRGASLNPNQTRWKLLEERQHGAALQLAADDHLASSINSVHLKHRLGDVESDGLPDAEGVVKGLFLAMISASGARLLPIAEYRSQQR